MSGMKVPAHGQAYFTRYNACAILERHCKYSTDALLMKEENKKIVKFLFSINQYYIFFLIEFLKFPFKGVETTHVKFE